MLFFVSFMPDNLTKGVCRNSHIKYFLHFLGQFRKFICKCNCYWYITEEIVPFNICSWLIGG